MFYQSINLVLLLGILDGHSQPDLNTKADSLLLASAVLKFNLPFLISNWPIRRNQLKSKRKIQNFTQQIQNLNSGARINSHSEQMHRQKGRALLPLRTSHQYSWVSDTQLQSPASQWVPNRDGKSLSYNFHISATPRPFHTAAASDWGWK